MARGKQWTFTRPSAEGKVIRFLNSGGETFGAMYQAQRWLHDHGYRYGSTDGGRFVPAVLGDRYDLPQKLYNFDLEDYKRVNAVMFSLDYREGWVEVWLVEYMECLDLIVTRQVFDRIDRGEATEVHRRACGMWARRLAGRRYTHVRLWRGTGLGRAAIFRYSGFRKGPGEASLGVPDGLAAYIIPLGERYK